MLSLLNVMSNNRRNLFIPSNRDVGLVCVCVRACVRVYDHQLVIQRCANYCCSRVGNSLD